MKLSQRDSEMILHPFTAYCRNALPVAVVRASGALFWDEDGKEYIDAIGSWWVNLHGHAHPYINERISAQIATLEHIMFSGFTHRPAVELAEMLLGVLPSSFSKIFYSDNGSTAVEVALKMAVQYWENKGQKKTTFIALKNSYHGDTFGAMSVSERDIFTAPFHQMLFRTEYIDAPGHSNTNDLLEKLSHIVREHDVAGFIFEPLVQGAGGMQMYDAAGLDRLLGWFREQEILTIADEVMTGFGRTGTLFAMEQCTVAPDFICLSKGLTGGYLPLGVTAFSHAVAEVFESEEASKTFYHGHSFTANPISCTAAIASLELLLMEETLASIEKINRQHLRFARDLKAHPGVADVRVKGVILAVEVKTAYSDYFYLDPVKELLGKFFLEKGLLMRPLGNVIYCIPPYCITDAQLEKIYDGILSSLDHLRNHATN